MRCAIVTAYASLALGVHGHAQLLGLAPDPYTKGKPAAMERLGYASFGPFPLGDDHATADVEELLGPGRLRWLETAHFRLGSSLLDRTLPEDAPTRKALYESTRRFKKRLGLPPVDPSVLDAWMQLHILAQVLEEAYDDFRLRLGVTPEWFRSHASEDGEGGGPYFGNAEKFVLLVFEQEADLARYLRRFCDCRDDLPSRHRFPRARAHVFATTAEAFGALLSDPLMLQAHAVHGTMQNIVDAFAIRAESVPFWWREGLAHWYARGVDPRLVEVADPNAEETSGTWDWAAKASARARQGLLPGQDDLLTWHDERACGFADHVALWAFVDYLLAQGDASFQRFALQVRQRPLRTRYCPATLALAWHDEAFRVAYGADRQALDARWRKSLQQARR